MVISLKLIWSDDHIRSNRIFSVNDNLLDYTSKICPNTRVRARLVRRLIWVEDLLCSNHNDPINKIYFILCIKYINKIYFILCIKYINKIYFFFMYKIH